MAKKKKIRRLRIADVLKQKGITKYRLAQLLGKPTSGITPLFKADYNPTFATLANLADVLDCQIADLIEE